MLQQFHRFYPQGSLVSELIEIDRGLYIVKVSAKQQDLVLGTGLAAANTVEAAEDQARERALRVVNCDNHNSATSLLSPQKELNSAPPTAEQSTFVPSSSVETTLDQVSVSGSPLVSTSAVTLESEPLVSSVSNTTVKPEIQTNIFDQPISSPESVQPSETSTDVFEHPAIASNEVAVMPETKTSTVEFDFNEIKHRIDLEMKRLNWTKEQGRDYLLGTYGKRSRLHLTDDELLEFLSHIESLPG